MTASDDVLDDIIQDDRARKVFLYAMVSKFVEQLFLLKYNVLKSLLFTGWKEQNLLSS